MPAKGSADGARRGAAEAARNAPRSGLVGFLLAPVFVGAGSIVGAATAEPAEVVEAAETTIQAAFADCQIPGTLRDRVVQVARAETRYAVVPHQSATGADAAGEPPDRADGAIATTLEVSVQEYGTKMPGSSSRLPLYLFLTVQVRLLRAADGSVLHTQQVAWVSEGRPLSAWAVAQGEPVRQELARAIQYLAERIVEVIFLVTSLP